MVIRIRSTRQRFYDEEGDGLSGQCSFPAPRRMFIRISRRHNRTVNAYAATLLHELLHAWVNVLELKGFKSDENEEEDFISAVEKIVVREFQKKFKRRKSIWIKFTFGKLAAKFWFLLIEICRTVYRHFGKLQKFCNER